MAAMRAIVTTLIATALARTAMAEPMAVEERELLAGDPLPGDAPPALRAPAPSFDEQLRRSGYAGVRYSVFRGHPDVRADCHDALAIGNLSLRRARDVTRRLHALAALEAAPGLGRIIHHAAGCDRRGLGASARTSDARSFRGSTTRLPALRACAPIHLKPLGLARRRGELSGSALEQVPGLGPHVAVVE